ncbi:MAG: restriction endonuclease subunit S [Cyclobacteriaceae bacterium]
MEKEKLSSVIEVLESGARPKGGAVEFQADTIPSLGAEHLNDFGGFNFDKVKYVPKSFFNDMTKGIIGKGDILVVKDGATTGKVSIVDDSFPFEKAAINEHVFLLRVSKDKAFNGYVFHFLKSPIGQIEIQKDFRGATVGGISRRFIDLIKLPFPPIKDQVRIANILSKAEVLISQRKESLRLLDELLKSTFLEMFGTPTNPKYETEVLDNLSLKITDGTHQSPKFTESGIPFILVSNIVDNEIVYDTSKFITEEEYNELIKRTPIEIGDILYTTVGSYGNAALVKSTKKFCFQRHIGYIKPDKAKINNTYLFGAMKSSFVRTQVDKAVKGVAQLTLNLSELKKIKIPVPPIKLQTQFAHIVEKTEALKAHYQTSLQELENLYGSLSQQAFKGELSLTKEIYLQTDKVSLAAEP